MDSDTIVQGVGLLASVTASVLVARLTSRNSAKASVEAASLSSRAVVEEEAYERAKEIWKDGVAELKDQSQRTAARAERAEAMVEQLQMEKGRLARQLDAMQRELRECKTLCRRLVARDEFPRD
mgnify:CR=1 FL=1